MKNDATKARPSPFDKGVRTKVRVNWQIGSLFKTERSSCKDGLGSFFGDAGYRQGTDHACLAAAAPSVPTAAATNSAFAAAASIVNPRIENLKAAIGIIEANVDAQSPINAAAIVIITKRSWWRGRRAAAAAVRGSGRSSFAHCCAAAKRSASP